MSQATTVALVHRDLNAPSTLETVRLDALQPDEALVEIHASGICHTDMSCMEGVLPAQLPAIFGHEGAGVVLEVGKNIKDVKAGDKVLLSYKYCENCGPCKSGSIAYCQNFVPANFGGLRDDGTSAFSLENGDKCFSNFFGQSSFAKKAVVHRTSICKVPDDTPLATYAPLGCGLQTGAGAVMHTLDVQPGSNVVVFGAGSVGMAAIMAAKIRGASKIIAVDLQQSRLNLAKTLGATDIIMGSDENVVEQIQKLCPPNGANYSVECTGALPVIEKAIDCLGTKGKAVQVGAPPPGKKVNVDPFNHLILGRQYLGCTEGESVAVKFIPYLMDQHKKGNFPLEKFVTFYDVKDFEKAFADMKQGSTIKAILKWDSV